MTASYLDVAVAYAARGWSVFPIRHKPNTPGKQPAWAEWTSFQTTRPDDVTLRRMFRQPNLDGLAVVLGPVSGGLAARDFDDEEPYVRWCRAHSALAHTLPTSRTRRGYHIFFTCTSVDAPTMSFDDGELRVSRCYVVLPPSRHPQGAVYEWVRPPQDAPPPPLDPFQVGLAAPLTERQRRTEENRETEAILCSSPSSLFHPVPEGRNAVARELPVIGPLDGLNGLDRSVEAAIRSTLPSGLHQRNSLMFTFARSLKAIPALRDVEVHDVRKYVLEWHRQALPNIGTKPFEETWADFVHAWPRVKYPMGMTPVEAIMAQIRTVELPETVFGYESEDTKRLVSLCFELQRQAGDQPFFLSCRTAMAACGFESHVTAWKRLNMLICDQVLQLVTCGGRHTASRFRFIGRE